MRFEQELCDNYVVVRPLDSRLDSIAAPEFRHAVLDLSEKHSLQIVVDLVEIEFMDSSGLGAIIGCYKATQESGGMLLCNVCDNVKEVFTLTHMDRIFEINDDLDACIRKRAA